MINAKNRKILSEDYRYRSCFITSRNDFIDIHHSFYGWGNKIEEMWNYVPLSMYYHKYGQHAVHDGNKITFCGEELKTRKVCALFSILRASEEDLIKYKLLHKKKGLMQDKNLVDCVLTLARRSGFYDDLNIEDDKSF